MVTGNPGQGPAGPYARDRGVLTARGQCYRRYCPPGQSWLHSVLNGSQFTSKQPQRPPLVQPPLWAMHAFQAASCLTSSNSFLRLVLEMKKTKAWSCDGNSTKRGKLVGHGLGIKPSQILWHQTLPVYFTFKSFSQQKRLVETDGCQTGGGEGIGEKGKENIVKDIVISSHGDRWLLGLVCGSLCKIHKCRIITLYAWN